MNTKNNNNLINGLSYISILFAPILFPLIVWLISPIPDVKQHAKSALWLHILPTILTVGAIFILITTGLLTNSQATLGTLTIILFFTIIIIDFGLVIWNIFKGIKLFLS